MFRHVLMSSTQPEIWSIQVVVKTRRAKIVPKCKTHVQGVHSVCFFLIRAIVLWCSRSRGRLPCVSSLMSLLNGVFTDRVIMFILTFRAKPNLSRQSQVLYEKLVPMVLSMITRESQFFFKNSFKNSLICRNAVTLT